MLHFGYILWCYSGHNAEKAKVIGVQNPNIVHNNSFIGLDLLNSYIWFEFIAYPPSRTQLQGYGCYLH